MDSIRASVDILKEWHLQYAPDSRWFNTPPASLKDIASAESEIGLRFPDEVRRLYLIHNGSQEESIFPYGRYLQSLGGLVNSWKMWKQHLDDGIFEPTTPHASGLVNNQGWWNAAWIPITHNAGGDHHCVDLDPTKEGKTGQILQFSHEVGVLEVLGSSLAEWLAAYARSLQAGIYYYDTRELWIAKKKK